jgi:hypothetical protein
MRKFVHLHFYLALLGASATAGAAEPRRTEPLPPPPAPTERQARPATPGGDAIEPEVTITSKGTEIHEEYRYNGQLYMVKVKPAKGPPYYLIYDERGTSRRSDLEPDFVAPSWVIKRF